MFELIYTSVPRGLIPGRSGFCTVAMTEGMPPNLVVPLENLSGYNFTYLEGALPPMLNPPSCSYIKMRYGNQHLHIASQVMPNGLDYSQRNNKIAHHILFESADEMNNLSGARCICRFAHDLGIAGPEMGRACRACRFCRGSGGALQTFAGSAALPDLSAGHTGE